ncbi:MAG: hypothetical protein IPM06_03370 [Rhizobiales bacterium]|nr:hypothetical protein [Hyphomicrobiales bacterium]
MTQPIRALLYGIISWAVPLAISIGFVDQTGQFRTDIRFFKSVMFVTATATAAMLLVSYFRGVKSGFLREGLLLGLLWLAMNLVLDLTVLVPMTGMSLRDYAFQIGFGYLAIPVITVLVGRVLEQKT